MAINIKTSIDNILSSISTIDPSDTYNIAVYNDQVSKIKSILSAIGTMSTEVDTAITGLKGTGTAKHGSLYALENFLTGNISSWNSSATYGGLGSSSLLYKMYDAINTALNTKVNKSGNGTNPLSGTWIFPSTTTYIGSVGTNKVPTTKEYVDNHINKIASTTESGHIKISDDFYIDTNNKLGLNSDADFDFNGDVGFYGDINMSNSESLDLPIGMKLNGDDVSTHIYDIGRVEFNLSYTGSGNAKYFEITNFKVYWVIGGYYSDVIINESTLEDDPGSECHIVLWVESDDDRPVVKAYLGTDSDTWIPERGYGYYQRTIRTSGKYEINVINYISDQAMSNKIATDIDYFNLSTVMPHKNTKASTNTFGHIKVDGTTIVSNNGVITAVDQPEYDIIVGQYGDPRATVTPSSSDADDMEIGLALNGAISSKKDGRSLLRILILPGEYTVNTPINEPNLKIEFIGFGCGDTLNETELEIYSWIDVSSIVFKNIHINIFPPESIISNLPINTYTYGASGHSRVVYVRASYSIEITNSYITISNQGTAERDIFFISNTNLDNGNGIFVNNSTISTRVSNMIECMSIFCGSLHMTKSNVKINTTNFTPTGSNMRTDVFVYSHGYTSGSASNTYWDNRGAVIEDSYLYLPELKNESSSRYISAYVCDNNGSSSWRMPVIINNSKLYIGSTNGFDSNITISHSEISINNSILELASNFNTAMVMCGSIVNSSIYYNGHEYTRSGKTLKISCAGSDSGGLIINGNKFYCSVELLNSGDRTIFTNNILGQLTNSSTNATVANNDQNNY